MQVSLIHIKYEIHHIVLRYLRFNVTAFFYHIRLLLLGLLEYKYQSSFNIEMWQQCKSMTKSLRTAFRQSQINEMTIFESKIFLWRTLQFVKGNSVTFREFRPRISFRKTVVMANNSTFSSRHILKLNMRMNMQKSKTSQCLSMSYFQ